MKPEKHGDIHVHAQRRESGLISVNLWLIGWKSSHLMSLGHQPEVQARIANRIALKVYELYGATEDYHLLP